MSVVSLVFCGMSLARYGHIDTLITRADIRVSFDYKFYTTITALAETITFVTLGLTAVGSQALFHPIMQRTGTAGILRNLTGHSHAHAHTFRSHSDSPTNFVHNLHATASWLQLLALQLFTILYVSTGRLICISAVSFLVNKLTAKPSPTMLSSPYITTPSTVFPPSPQLDYVDSPSSDSVNHLQLTTYARSNRSSPLITMRQQILIAAAGLRGAIGNIHPQELRDTVEMRVSPACHDLHVPHAPHHDRIGAAVALALKARREVDGFEHDFACVSTALIYTMFTILVVGPLYPSLCQWTLRHEIPESVRLWWHRADDNSGRFENGSEKHSSSWILGEHQKNTHVDCGRTPHAHDNDFWKTPASKWESSRGVNPFDNTDLVEARRIEIDSKQIVSANIDNDFGEFIFDRKSNVCEGGIAGQDSEIRHSVRQIQIEPYTAKETPAEEDTTRGTHRIERTMSMEEDKNSEQGRFGTMNSPEEEGHALEYEGMISHFVEDPLHLRIWNRIAGIVTFLDSRLIGFLAT